MRARLMGVAALAVVAACDGNNGSNGNRVDTTPPTLNATVEPAPNAAGWNNTSVAVHFACADSGSGIATCSDTVSISAEGADQSVNGSATDKAGNAAHATVNVNIDRTAPTVAVTQPASGAVLTSSTAAVQGTVSDALSGVSSVTCNGAAATLDGGSFSCNVALNSGANTITIMATDRAGNGAASPLAVSFNAAATHTVGGTIAGLTGSGLVLQDNGGDNLAIATTDTAFTFATGLASGAPYAVSVLTQPTNPSQGCVVGNGSGSVAANDVTNVTVTCGSLASLPKTRDLIAQALAAGRIDLETSFEYRLWAFFMDPRLPQEYEGPDLGTEDTALFFEIHQAWATLSPNAQAVIQPYLLRPADPGSIFSGGTTPVVTAQARRKIDAAAADTGVPCASWIKADAAVAYVTVWVCGSGNNAADLAIRANVIDILDRHWPAMTADMGEPRHDDGAGGDDRIDVYVVPLASCIPRHGTCEGITIPQEEGQEPADATTPPWAAVQGSPGGTSGYQILRWDRAAAGGVAFEADVVHEFFHVLQFAHMDYNGGAWRSWFVEASAKWSEWAYVPDASATEVHIWYPASYLDDANTEFDGDSYQPGHISLQLRSRSTQHDYASYIWPYFMQQEVGSTAVVGNAWRASDFATDAATIDSAINRQLAFADDFGDFIVRNLNAVLPGDPLQTHFWDLDANFPHTNDAAHPVVNRLDLPQYEPLDLIDGMERVPIPFEIQNLSAIYSRFKVSPTSGIGHVLFEFESSGDLPDVEAVAAVVNDDGSHTYKRFTATDHKKLEFCFANPAQHVDSIILALGDHDFARGSTDAIPTMNGTMYITTDENCGEWTGTLTYVLKNVTRQETVDELGTEVEQTHEITTETWSLGAVKPDPTLPTFQQLTIGWTANDEVNDTYDLEPSSVCSGTLHSSTTGTQGFGATLTYDIYPGVNNTISFGPPFGVTPPATPTKDWTPAYESQSCDGDTITGDGATRTLSDQNGAPLSLYGPVGGFTATQDDPNHYQGTNTVVLTPDVTATVTWDFYHNAP